MNKINTQIISIVLTIVGMLIMISGFVNTDITYFVRMLCVFFGGSMLLYGFGFLLVFSDKK